MRPSVGGVILGGIEVQLRRPILVNSDVLPWVKSRLGSAVVGGHSIIWPYFYINKAVLFKTSYRFWVPFCHTHKCIVLVIFAFIVSCMQKKSNCIISIYDIY